MNARRRKRKPRKSDIWRAVAVLTIGTIGLFYYYTKDSPDYENIRRPNTHERAKLRRVEKNYGNLVDILSNQFDISSSYLKALITLECSGLKPPKSRFESHVFEQLKKVRDKQITNYGSITYKTIGDASDDALKNLATSWGPFQLMGYQCIELDVHVKDIRGSNSLYWGIYWIDKRYGKYLKNEDYKSAFHIHNTGQPFPSDGASRTYDPKYVEKGLVFMRYFELGE